MSSSGQKKRKEAPEDDTPEEAPPSSMDTDPPSSGEDQGGSSSQSKKSRPASPGLEEAAAAADERVRRLTSGGASSWARPPLPASFDPARDSVPLMLVDADYYTTKSPAWALPGREPLPPRAGEHAVVRCFGVTEEGHSVTVHIHHFQAYFFVPCWPGFADGDCTRFALALNQALREDQRGRHHPQCVLKVDAVRRQSIWGYHFGELSDFMQVTVAVPPLVASARRLLERGLSVPGLGGTGAPVSFQTYETNLPYVLRYMVDKDIRGGGWVELPAGSYAVRAPAARKSHAQLEVDVHCDDVVAHQPQGEWLKVAPLRVLSFDIECAGRKGVFPEPEVDPVIQIANLLSVQGRPDEPVAKNVFTLGSCAHIAGAEVIECAEERDLLTGWADFLRAADPDVVTGYNICNFDLPYLLDRAKALRLPAFPFLGRLRDKPAKVKDATFSSSAFGTRTDKDVSMEGRIQFDLLKVLRREYKLRSYSLNAVSAHFLGQQKEDVHFSIITDLQNGNEETRRRLARYCLKDAVLPQRLLDKLLLLINYIEMARVTGVPISFLISRGQQIKVVSQLYRKARQHSLVIPVRERNVSDDKYEGATVIEPKKGFYKDPVATLDFASLYPSIMQAHNLCYTTLVPRSALSRLAEDEYTRTPNGHCFVKASKRRGLLPEVLGELLAARKKAKKDMAAATDPFLKAVLNGRQLALKISANSVYGFTGAQVGQLPCLEISSSVTAFGRQMIDQTKEAVEQKYCRANGYEHDADVIYGDTDSVMVKFGAATVAESMRLGEEAAAHVSGIFPSPIRLEFEKVYHPYLLMNKKRYAGLYWTRPEKWDKLDAKGIETVRRDSCSLVATVVQRVLDKIIVESNVEEALEYTRRVVADLLTNRLDLSMLVISKQLGKTDYAVKMAHVELAKRMQARDPRSAPQTGDRVPYVIIRAAKGAAAYEKAEDPIYVLENDVPIDASYYLHNQLEQPLTRIFEPIMGKSKVTSLFHGDHTRAIKISTPSKAAGGIMRFAVKRRTCQGCKTPLTAKDGAGSLCQHCQGNEASLYVQQVDRIREHERLFARVWSQCQACQGSLHQDVLCTSRDCPIFYRRKKVQKDLQEAQAALDRFEF